MKRVRNNEALLRAVEQLRDVCVTVVGDLVADEFVFGEISRVSREAPVLILKHRERSVVPGGGANAVYNLAALGVRVFPVGVIGDDEPGRLLMQRFREKKIATSGIVKIKGYPTVTKSRILAGMTHSSRQQVVRVDREPEREPELSVQRQLVASAREFARTSDAMLISDYGYGSATPAIWDGIRAAGRTKNLPVTLDSRYRMLEYCGITAATPNEPEVEEALKVSIGHDRKALQSAGQSLRDRMKLDALVITRGRDGMACFEDGKPPVEIPIYGSDQVTDVTGAGDTVIATFTAALATGIEPESAARLANYAGGIVVMKRGTATVSREELLAAVESDPR